MTEDRTLDDFVGEERGGDADERGDAPSDSGAGADSDSADFDPADSEPAAATYRWSPDGTGCDDCGALVERRWLDDGEYVCAACKEW